MRFAVRRFDGILLRKPKNVEIQEEGKEMTCRHESRDDVVKPHPLSIDITVYEATQTINTT